MAKNKTPRKKNTASSDCPIGCKMLKLRIDCSSWPDWPEGMPFPPRKKPNGWKVTTICRRKTPNKSPTQMRTMFSNYYQRSKNQEIPPEMQKWAKEKYKINVKFGEELIIALRNDEMNPEIHHILPVMLGGQDIASNYIPIRAKDHQYSSGGVHKWWDDQYRASQNQLESKLGMCKCDRKKTKKSYSKKKECALRNCARKSDGKMKVICESRMTYLSKCLNNQNIKLYVDCHYS